MQKIIVIEDSSFMRARLVSLLHSQGYTNTEEFAIADDIARKPQLYLHDAALIISDIQLPGISGIDLAKKLRKDSKFAEIPVFFVSGYGDPKTIAAAARTGAADYLVKPFENAVFLEKVKNLLDRINEIPAEFLISDEEFSDAVLSEYQRATRGNQYLSMLKLKIDKPDIVKCIYQVKGLLRRIDTCRIYKNSIILILPMTNEAGAAVVHEKMKAVLAENTIELPESGLFTFSSDSALSSGDFLSAVLAFAI